MARTLKTSGIAASLVYCVAPDTDHSIKEWVSSDVNANMTLSGCNTGTASWKGSTLGYWQPNSGSLVFASGHRPLIPAVLTAVFLMVDAPASNNASGLMDTDTQSTIVRDGNASQVIALIASGSGVAQTTTQITSSRSYSLGLQGRNSAGNNLTWYGLESGSAAVDTTTTYISSNPNTGDAVTQLGNVAFRGRYTAKYVLCAMFNTLLTTAEFQSLHNDPMGTLFDSAGGGAAASRPVRRGGPSNVLLTRF